MSAEVTLTESELGTLREALHGYLDSGFHGNLVPAVEGIIAARLAEQREGIAREMPEAFADRVEWRYGTHFIATADAARIAREYGREGES